MAKVILAGADVHDKSILVKVSVDSGEPQTKSWRNNARGRSAMIKSLRKLAGKSGAREVYYVYEASCIGFGLHDELTDAGVKCFVLAPTKIRKSVRDRRSKTDEKDAQVLLELLRGHVLAGNKLPAVWVPDKATRDDRELMRTRLSLSDELVAIKARIRMLLKRNQLVRPVDVDVDVDTDEKDNWTNQYRSWLEGLSSEKSELRLGARETLRSLLKRLDFHEEHTSELDGAVRRLSRTERYRSQVRELTRLKGVGILTAMVFLTEMGDLRRFANRRQVGAYLGLVPGVYESGAASDRKGRITKEGSPRVRRVLCQATWARVRTDKEEQRYYGKVAERNPKHKKKAVVASMRRLAVRMWHAAMRGLPEGSAPAPAGCGCASPTSSVSGPFSTRSRSGRR